MTTDQFMKLLEVFENIAAKQYTISQATDWPILVMGGGVIAGLVGFMWRDLKATFNDSVRSLNRLIREHREEARANLKALREDNDKEHDIFRAEIKELQSKVGPITKCKKQ